MAKYVLSSRDYVVYGSLNAARVAASKTTSAATDIDGYRERGHGMPVGCFYKTSYFSPDARILGSIGIWESASTGRFRFVKRDGSLGASADGFVRRWGYRTWFSE